MTYFLLTYDRRDGSSNVQPFDDGAEAMDRYYELELEHLASDRVEVVLLTAESESDLHRTHSRYFRPDTMIPA